MDAMKILGGLLGNQGISSGIGKQILQGVLGGQMGGSPLPSRSPGRSTAGMGGGAGLLGGLLQMAMQKAMAGAANPPMSSSRPLPSPNMPQPTHHSPPHPGHSHSSHSAESVTCDLPPDQANAQAAVLVRAMINAAKADGRVDAKEQEAIVSRLGQVSAEEAQFVRQEIARPLDMPKFIASIPQGMEQDVYAISVMAIELDSDREVKYLDDLGQSLSLSPQMMNEIHDQLGAPRIYPG